MSQTRGNWAGRNTDRWNVSPSSNEMLEDASIPEDLRHHRGPLEEYNLGYDLNEFQDLESLGKVEPASPLSESVKEDANIGCPSPVCHCHPERDRQCSFEEQEKPEEEWAEGSKIEPFLDLSYQGLYSSEFSISPEALKNPLALLDKHENFDSFPSEGEEEKEFSENDNLQFSSGSPPPQCFKTALGGTQGQLGSSQEFLNEREFSSESGKSPENGGASPLVGSLQWSCSPLGSLFLKDFQNSPSFDAELFPGSSWMENLAHLDGDTLKMATGVTVQHAQTPKEPTECCLDVSEEIEGSLKPLDHHLPERARKPKEGVPRRIPTRFGQQSMSLSPQRTPSWRQAAGLGMNGPIRENQPTLSMSNSVQYGRGRLNYPLPDLSKVEPRVQFPKYPHSYCPPHGKTLAARPKDSRKPVVFKSPAEIVQEVLLSNGEGAPQKLPAATISVIPEELKSPQQATELVHQLQEDYCKLLTKYAEAENTIDCLRLGAKMCLYSDFPKPSQGIQMGTVSHASRFLTFSIPQVQTAEVTVRPGPAPDMNKGFSGQSGVSQGTGLRREDGLVSRKNSFSGEELTQALAGQASKFQKQVEFLEELIHAGRLTPQEQLKGFARLKGAQGALEQAYLQARNEHRQRQKHLELAGALGEFDPDRALEGEIFHHRMQLAELKERIQLVARHSPAARDRFEAPCPLPVSHLAQDSEGQMVSPALSLQAPIPASHAPQPEVAIPQGSHYRDPWDLEVSDDPRKDAQDLLEPLQHMHHQVEMGFGHLLDHYSRFKSLPGSLSLEQLHPDGQGPSPEEVGGAADWDVRRQDGSLQTTTWRNKGTRMLSLSRRESQLRHASRHSPRKSHQLLRQVLGDQTHMPLAPELAEKSQCSASVPGRSSRRQQKSCSPLSSTASLADTLVSSSIAQKLFGKMNMASSESPPAPSHGEPPGNVGKSNGKHPDLHVWSPEMDSGFMGSEASQTSPLAQTLKHYSTPSRSCHTPGKATPVEEAVLAELRSEAPRAVGPLEGELSPRLWFPADGLQGQCRSKGPAFHLRTPAAWTNGIAAEAEPIVESTHTDLEAKAEEELDSYGTASEEMGCLSRPSAALFSSAQMARSSFLDSRLERNQAITALQSKVFQLWQSLEESLGQFHHPTKTPPTLPALRCQVLHRCGACCSPRAKEMPKTSGSSMSASEPMPPVADQGTATKRSLVPTRKTQGNLGCSSQLESVQASQSPPQTEGEAKACVLCRGREKISREVLQGFARAGEHPTPHPPGARPELSKAAEAQQPVPWYMTVSVPAMTVQYLPMVPYPLSSIIPLSSTTSAASPAGLPVDDANAFQAAELKTWALQQQPQPHPQMQDTSDSERDLHRSLCQAMEAAQAMKVISQQMSRSLAWELSKAKGLQGSCLF